MGKNIKYDEFVSTIQKTLRTWAYFVDFKKVELNASSIERELDLLNGLIFVEESHIDDELINIIRVYPKVRKVLPLLIGVREKSLISMSILANDETLDIEDVGDLFDDSIELNDKIEKGILFYFKESGLRELFVGKSLTNIIKSLYIGIEIGLDSNARKNRTGKIMESIVSDMIEEYCKINGFSMLKQVTSKDVLTNWGVKIRFDKIGRQIDFAILTSDNKVKFIETNFYNCGGSKIKSTSAEYEKLQNIIEDNGMEFIWVSDGLGWVKETTVLNQVLSNINNFWNIKMLSKRFFKIKKNS